MSRFLDALAGKPVDATPVWFMRQAGRYLPEYRAVRKDHDFLTMVKTPEIAAEITLQPIRRFGLDAAVIYSDLLPPLQTMGLGLHFEPGVGPVIENPIRSTKDVDLLATPPAGETMPWTPEAIRLVKRELGDATPVLGFAGAPFTLAAYAIEGGGSKKYERTRVFMYSEPAAWARLMDKLVTVAGSFLTEQATAGADALQVFDSWAGALSRSDYERYAAPYTSKLIAIAQKTGRPVVHFTTGTAGHLDAVAAAGGDAIGVDAGPSLVEARERTGGRPLQGNLDPYLLQAPWRELRAQTDRVLAEAPATGYVFNTGHGLVPATPPDAVARLTDYVREKTSA
ncbi:uroporphyrinogen decarboxylase [Rubrivirga sp.]|uniref:uroporphyrinogen decarboxylase n=1 Tax=Rubrivirga sp. TaxID=1885344 RepID=UPI003B522F29